MDIELLPIVMLIGGLVLLYGAVNNRNPLDVVQLALRGEDITKAAPLSTGTSSGVNVIPGQGVADPGEMHTNPRGPRLFPDGSPRYADDPQPNELPDGDPRKKFKGGVPRPGEPGDPRPPLNARRNNI